MNSEATDAIVGALDAFRIELPSWGFANTGTRFGKYLQPAAATTTRGKIQRRRTGARDHRRLPDGRPARALGSFRRTSKTPARSRPLAARLGVRARRHQPESLPGPELQVRIVRQPGSRRSRHARSNTTATAWRSRARSTAATSRSGSRTARTIRARPTSASASAGSRRGCGQRTRRSRPTSGCSSNTSRSSRRSTTPTSPTGGWRCCWRAPPGRRRKVLVDTGHHYQSQNIEQIVAWLLDEEMLGGFHFNDRRYADDDLTLGIDRSVPGVPHLPRNSALRMGDRRTRRHRLHDRSEPQPQRARSTR